MEHITVTKLIYNPAETKRKRIARREEMEIVAWNIILKILGIVTIVNMMFHWDKIVTAIGG